MPPMLATVERQERPASQAERACGADFYCLRFAVWYPSRDCASRTLHRTYDGCAGCDQGRFNLQRHRAALQVRDRRRGLARRSVSPSNATV